VLVIPHCIAAPFQAIHILLAILAVLVTVANEHAPFICHRRSPSRPRRGSSPPTAAQLADSELMESCRKEYEVRLLAAAWSWSLRPLSRPGILVGTPPNTQPPYGPPGRPRRPRKAAPPHGLLTLWQTVWRPRHIPCRGGFPPPRSTADGICPGPLGGPA